MLLCKCVVLVFYNLVLSTSTWLGLYVKKNKEGGRKQQRFYRRGLARSDPSKRGDPISPAGVYVKH